MSCRSSPFLRVSSHLCRCRSSCSRCLANSSRSTGLMGLQTLALPSAARPRRRMDSCRLLSAFRPFHGCLRSPRLLGCWSFETHVIPVSHLLLSSLVEKHPFFQPPLVSSTRFLCESGPP